MFDDHKLYFASDPDLQVIGSYSTLSHWRSASQGPEYIRLGPQRVAYAGSALNEWLRSRTVRTEQRT